MKKTNVDCCAEFSIEMVLAVPYAYWLFKQGKLGKTISGQDTQSLYFFSQNHEEKYHSRHISTEVAKLNNLPNSWIHHNSESIFGKSYDDLTEHEKVQANGKLDFSKWEFPPYKEFYRNDLFQFDKPPILISNKYVSEWNHQPVNFFNLPTLYEMLALLYDHYTIIYKRPQHGDFIGDENEKTDCKDIMGSSPELGTITDKDLCRKVGVTVYDDLQSQFPQFSYNEFQFLLYSNIDNYISVQGGNSHICSAFGKKNINLVKEGRESRPGYVDENSWYYRMNRCKTYVVQNETDLIQRIKEIYL